MHPSSVLRRAVRITALLLLAACAREAGAGAQPVPGQTRDSAGIRIVTSADAPGEQWVIEDEPLVRIQHEETPARIVPVRLRDGFVLVDTWEMELRFFDAQGRFVKRVGGQMEAPGEFESIDWVQALSPDSVVVWDGFNRRLNVFTADGRLARRVEADLGSMGMPKVHGMFRDGSLLVSSAPRERMDRAAGSTWRDTATFLRVSPAGEVVDTVGAFPAEEQFQYVPHGDMRAHSRWVPLGLRLVTAVEGETFWIGAGPAYELRQFRADGTPVRIARVDRGPRALPAGVRELYLREEVPAPGGETILPSWTHFVGQAPFPRAAAPFEDLSIDAGGRLWVRRARTPDEPPHGVIADLLDAEGRLIGTVSGTRRFFVDQVGPDWVLGQVRGPNGTRVELRRLVRR
jgi:hypothetical protein